MNPIKIGALFLFAHALFIQAKDKLTLYMQTKDKQRTHASSHDSRHIVLKKINVEKITNIDVIVNPANQWLQHGGGIAGALSKAAGPKLQQESNCIIQTFSHKRLPVGSVISTESYNLLQQGIKNIFHAVGPDCRNSGENEKRKELLETTYQNIFAELKRKNHRSIAIPPISMGIFGYPDVSEAISIAVSHIVKAFEDGIEIVVFSNDIHMLDRYAQALCKKSVIFAQNF